MSAQPSVPANIPPRFRCSGSNSAWMKMMPIRNSILIGNTKNITRCPRLKHVSKVSIAVTAVVAPVCGYRNGERGYEVAITIPPSRAPNR
jgi:hypothetical protein